MSDWSNLAEDARTRTGEPGPRCMVEKFLNSLSEYNRTVVKGTLADPGLATTGLAQSFKSIAPDVAPSAWSISNHRAGKCRCSR